MAGTAHLLEVTFPCPVQQAPATAMIILRAPRQMPEFTRMNRAARPVVLAMALAVGSAACDESLSDVAGPTPNLEPTFSSIQQEIFNMTDSSGRQACIPCHIAGGPCRSCR